MKFKFVWKCGWNEIGERCIYDCLCRIDEHAQIFQCQMVFHPGWVGDWNGQKTYGC